MSAVHLWRTPASAAQDLQVMTHLMVYGDIFEHAVSSLPNETGGFLLGRVGRDEQRRAWHVEIDECVPVTPLEQDPVHFSFTWRDVDRVRRYREENRKALVGWYHTHPDLGIFLSDTDLEKMHRVLFGELFQIALVYDPVRGRAGYFFWESPQVIDPSPAMWREFSIGPPEDDGEDGAFDGDRQTAEPLDTAGRTKEPTGTGEDASGAPAASPDVPRPAAAADATAADAVWEERTDS